MKATFLRMRGSALSSTVAQEEMETGTEYSTWPLSVDPLMPPAQKCGGGALLHAARPEHPCLEREVDVHDVSQTFLGLLHSG